MLNPTRNLFCNARDSIGNVLVNEGNTIKWTAHHEDPSTFKFQELQDRNVNKTNRISKRQW
ncbi:MAG: hypothetical protein LBD11_01865 [Candidatus Peribacteria bacterium]|nr:hypothetical protein [Candidatus Peribacteria bacterium]